MSYNNSVGVYIPLLDKKLPLDSIDISISIQNVLVVKTIRITYLNTFLNNLECEVYAYIPKNETLCDM